MSNTDILESSYIRRHLTSAQKLAIVEASHEAGAIVGEVARRYRVGLSSLVKWRKLAKEGSLMGIQEDTPVVGQSEVKRLKKEIKQLQQLLGKQSLQIELLKDAVTIAREKKLISQKPLPGVDDILSE